MTTTTTTATTTQGRLQGRVAIVTGSSSGLGQAICLAFAAEGASVFCIDLHPTAAGRMERPSFSTDVPLPLPLPLSLPLPLKPHSPPPSLHHSPRGATTMTTTTTVGQQQAGTHERIRQMGGEATWHRADVTRAQDMELAVRACVQQYGRVDIMVNNAGVSVESTHARPLRCHETGEDDWDRTLAVNAKGMFLGCKYALKQMLAAAAADATADSNDRHNHSGGEVGRGTGSTSTSTGTNNTTTPPPPPTTNTATATTTTAGQPQRYASRGWIVNVASVQGLVPYYGTPSYCASKGAAVMLTKQIALDYAPDKIHCNALCPGFLDTRMTQNLQSQDHLLRDIQHKHPFGGTLGNVDDVAKAAVFLASDDAAWITGVPLPVDGAYLLR